MRPSRVVLTAIAVSTLVRLYLAFHFYGFQTGDDAEIAEEALRRVVGLACDPWPIRNLFVSEWIVAPFLWVAKHVAADWGTLAALSRLPFVALAGVNVYLTFAVARRWTDERVAALAACLYSLHWIPLVYGSAQYPRTVSVTCVLLALLVGERAPFAAGALVAVATAARYSEAIYLATLLLLLPRRLRALAGFAAGCLVLLGAYEWATWGKPFAALVSFARFTLEERASSSAAKHQPVWWYVTSLPFWIAPMLWPFFAKANARWMAATIAIPVAILSCVHHKELRYLQVVVPFVSIAAAEGAVKMRRNVAVSLIAVAIPWQLYRVHIVDRRSMSAVAAARWMSARNVSAVGLSQVWAYGGRIYLGNAVKVVDLDVPPGDRELGNALATADCVAMYEDDVAPRAARLARSGFAEAAKFRIGRGAPVVAACRRQQQARP